MAVSKKTSIILFLITLVGLLISLIFKKNITGYAAFSSEAYSFIAYDSLLILVVGAIVLSATVTFIKLTSEEEAIEELKEFKVDEPNTSMKNLKKYIEHCLSQGRPEGDIRVVLEKAKWDKALVDSAIDGVKKL